MNLELRTSYRYCGRLARRSASSFYYSFFLLPPAKRAAMCALYAFLRHTDDLADNQLPLDERRKSLDLWRQSLSRAMNGGFDSPILPALRDTVTKFEIPLEYLIAVIDGVEMDLEHTRYQTFAELEDYCYHVASVVGLACVHVWGFRGEVGFESARQCGVAFQLTNILRDLQEDAANGRIYLPQEDLADFGYKNEELVAGIFNDCFRRMMRFEVGRAEELYRQASDLAPWLHPDGQRVFGAMMATYRGLLDEIRRRDGDVFTRRVRLSRWQKLKIAIRWFLLPPQPQQLPAVLAAGGR